MTVLARTTGADDTRKLAAALAELTRPGDVILLGGDLGAGKTAFAQGLARGLGVTESVTSPTFMLARQYLGRLVLHHLDVYRLDHMEELFDIGLPELLDEGAVTVIEWGDAIAAALPPDYLEIKFAFDDDDASDDNRALTLRAVGSRWAARNRAVVTALESWIVGGGQQGC
ncbi:MAG: tRNA (adenosine(37)-N6)-threonylcarbamoyltransferase complex ATPase subunit type 1 TsaE [Acidimicrobiales bacterium]